MARKKDIHEQCGGKVKFDTKAQASGAAATLNDRGGKRCKAYKCNFCGKYHFGHESKGSKLSKSDKSYIPPFNYEPGVHKVKDIWVTSN